MGASLAMKSMRSIKISWMTTWWRIVSIFDEGRDTTVDALGHVYHFSEGADTDNDIIGANTFEDVMTDDDTFVRLRSSAVVLFRSGSFVGSTRRNAYVRVSGGDSKPVEAKFNNAIAMLNIWLILVTGSSIEWELMPLIAHIPVTIPAIIWFSSWSAVDTDAGHAYYFVHGLLDSSEVVTTAQTHDQVKRGLDGRGKEINLRAYRVSTMCGVYGASVRWTSAEDPAECTDRDSYLVMNRDKDMDMVHLDRDFNVSAWAYGQPSTEEPETYACYCHVRRQMVYSLLGGLGGAQLVTKEPSLSRRSPVLQSKMGAWPWAGQGRLWDLLVEMRMSEFRVETPSDVGRDGGATMVWLRRDERRGGVLSIDRRRDFDEFDVAMDLNGFEGHGELYFTKFSCVLSSKLLSVEWSIDKTNGRAPRGRALPEENRAILSENLGVCAGTDLEADPQISKRDEMSCRRVRLGTFVLRTADVSSSDWSNADVACFGLAGTRCPLFDPPRNAYFDANYPASDHCK
ncbi:hypothetical protein Syun_001340 [Stephania yunnanensis]|uniref:Uncharacterized protein n=1 Tax=Stephania yunnanensis TaxID=152371 RepID=A0AAP0LGG6_9MAGN